MLESGDLGWRKYCAVMHRTTQKEVLQAQIRLLSILLEILLRVKAFKERQAKVRKAEELMGEEIDENEDIHALGGFLKMSYMKHVEGEELPRETEGCTEFIENRLKLRKYFRELKLHTTNEWRQN